MHDERSVSPLFTPITIAGLALPNRIVMAPMTRSRSPGGVPGADVAAYYRRRAEHAVGLIITEGTAIDHPAAVSNAAIPHLYGDDALDGWRAVVGGVHAAGGRIFAQLWHVGMRRAPGSEPNPEAPSVGPSGLSEPGKRTAAPMTDAEVTGVIAAYGRSAGHAYRVGFDGIELHGAHGYLIDQFLWSGTNERTDRYGGDIRARTTFAVEVVRACRRATSAAYPIAFRFSQWKIPQYEARLATSPSELAMLLEPLVDAGVDLFHCSTRRFWQPEFEGSELNLAGWTKQLTGTPTITVGSVGLTNDFIAGLFERRSADHAGLERLVAMLERGEFDLVAVGRALLADPAWAAKIRDGRTDLVPYTPAALETLS